MVLSSCLQVYDLTLEEKLLAEIEGDKKAREAAKRNKESQGKMTPKKPKVTGVLHFLSLTYTLMIAHYPLLHLLFARCG